MLFSYNKLGEIMIKNLKGIVIDAGHGGSDSGAVGNGIIEKDLTLKIATYIANRLKELGLPVTLTRSDDTTLDPKTRVNKILSAYGNDPNVLVISNHINAGGGDGAEVIYALRNDDTLAKLILNEIGAAGQNTRKVYQRRLPSNPSKDYYFIHRETGKTEPIIVEYGFLDSKGDDVNQLKNNYEKYAEAVVKAIAEYLNVPYNEQNEENSNYYIVKRGDTLYSIALANDTSVTKLKELNNLVSNNLEIGQKLLIPGSNITELTEYYIVKKGDSLYTIALKNNTTVDELKRINNLTTNLINIGQKILLPTNEYIVKPGDTLYSIASNNGLTVDELKKINNLESNVLSVGQKLSLVKPILANETYTVQKGDSLYSIAKKFNTNVNILKELNNLNSNLLSIGQTLILPN